jgi:hypothetical protein
VHEELNYNLYNGQNFKYFIGAGVGFNFSSYPLNEETYIREATTDTTTIVNDNYIAYIKKFWLSAIIKTGISVMHIEVSIAYAPNSTISGVQGSNTTGDAQRNKRRVYKIKKESLYTLLVY